jgi:TonB family protein
MRKETKDKHFLKKPSYPGGLDAMKAFIGQNLTYPQEAIKNKISGLVQVELTIEHTGKVVDTKVLHSLGYGCDEEAQRVARLLQFHVPKNRGIKVRFFKKINMHFGLQEKTIDAPVQNTNSEQSNHNIMYNYVTAVSVKPTPLKPAAVDQKPKLTYTIQIQVNPLK